MENFTEYDLIQAISGVDKNGNGKCSVGLRHQRCRASDGRVRDVDDEFITEKPVVNLFRQPGGFFIVDLCFQSVEDRDLRTVFAYLQKFFAPENSALDDDLEFPLLSLSIVPEQLDGEYWALGMNPLHYTLTPEDSTGEPRIIRLLFMSQMDPDALPNFFFMKSDSAVLEEMREECYEE